MLNLIIFFFIFVRDIIIATDIDEDVRLIVKTWEFCSICECIRKYTYNPLKDQPHRATPKKESLCIEFITSVDSERFPWYNVVYYRLSQVTLSLRNKSKYDSKLRLILWSKGTSSNDINFFLNVIYYTYFVLVKFQYWKFI